MKNALLSAALFGALQVARAANGDNTGSSLTAVEQITYGLNLLWVVVGAVLVILSIAGFTLLESGLSRAKAAGLVSAQKLAVFCLSISLFWAVGYSWSFSGISAPTINLTSIGSTAIGEKDHVFLWTGGYGLSGKAYDFGHSALFVYMAAFTAIVAGIPVGALSGRWRWSNAVAWGIFCGAWYHPMLLAWTWGNGWLAQLGNSGDIAFGFVDFGGSGVIHLQGGVAALVGALVIGPRSKRSRLVNPHSVPIAVAGALLVFAGWFGRTSAFTLAATDLRFPVVAVNTAIAGVFGGFVAALYVPLRTGKANVAMIVNGMVAGLVAITASSAFVTTWAAFIIGSFAGIIVIESSFLVQWAHIDDPVNAIPVHFFNGIWGLIALGLFADGTYGQGWNKTTSSSTAGVGVVGLFYRGELGGKQMAAQLIGALTIIIWQGLWALAFFGISKLVWPGGIRVASDKEDAVDREELGEDAYPDFVRSDQLEVRVLELLQQRVVVAQRAPASPSQVNHHQSVEMSAQLLDQ